LAAPGSSALLPNAFGSAQHVEHAPQRMRIEARADANADVPADLDLDRL
jgi:hypothetical protein